MKISTGRHRAFTLTELLVVIAIIGALVAITIPTIGAFRSSAHSAACASNMRQISSAVLGYAGDNNGFFPTRKNSSGSTMGLQYVAKDPLAEDKGKLATAENQKDYYLPFLLMDYTNNADIWQCPGNKAGWDASPSGVSYLANNRPDTDPPYFFGKLIGSGVTSGSPETMPKALSQMLARTDASRLWMISDADSINYPLGSLTQAKVQPPHKGKRNYVFFDGHVEARGLKDLPLKGNMGWPVP